MEVSETTTKAKKQNKNRVPPSKLYPQFTGPPFWNLEKVLHPRPVLKQKENNLNLTFESVDDYRLVQQSLIKNKIQYHSYILDDAKPLRVVLRGLPVNTSVQEIQIALELEELSGVTVTQMYRGPVSNKHLMLLF